MATRSDAVNVIIDRFLDDWRRFSAELDVAKEVLGKDEYERVIMDHVIMRLEPMLRELERRDGEHQD